MTSLRKLYLIVKEDLINLIKNPMWVFYVTAFPVLITLILGYLTRDSFGSKVTSYDYYGIAGMIYAILNSGMISANAFMEERIKKPNMRIIYSPGAVRYIYVSKIIASFIFGYVFHVIDFIFIKLVLGVNFGNTFYILMMFGVLDIFFCTLGIMLCCILKTETNTNQFQSIVVNVLAILGGVVFSLDSLGNGARIVSKCTPVKWVMDAVFQMIYDKDMHLYLPVIVGFLLCISAMIFVCDKTFKKEDCIC